MDLSGGKESILSALGTQSLKSDKVAMGSVVLCYKNRSRRFWFETIPSDRQLSIVRHSPPRSGINRSMARYTTQYIVGVAIYHLPHTADVKTLLQYIVKLRLPLNKVASS